MKQSRLLCLAILVACAMSVGLLGSAGAQTPTQTSELASTATPAVQTWPYRFIVSAPANADVGSDVSFNVYYELVGPQPDVPATPSFVFTWPAGAATFVSSSVYVGPAGAMSYTDGENSLRWDFSESPNAGSVFIKLRLAPSFTGSFRVAMYVPGTGIQLPEGSVDSASAFVLPFIQSPTSIDTLRSIVDSLFSGDEGEIESLLRFTTASCTEHPMGIGAPPECRAGETDGTPIDVFPVASCEGFYARPDTLDGIVSRLAASGSEVAAVYRYSTAAGSSPFLYGDFVAVVPFPLGSTTTYGGVWIGNGGITGVHSSCGAQSVEEFAAFWGLTERVDLTTSALPPTGTGEGRRADSPVIWDAALALAGVLLAISGLGVGTLARRPR